MKAPHVRNDKVAKSEWQRLPPVLFMLLFNLGVILLLWWVMTGTLPKLTATLEDKRVWIALIVGMILVTVLYLLSNVGKKSEPARRETKRPFRQTPVHP